MHPATITPCDGVLNEYSRFPIVSNASLQAHRPMARMVRAGTLQPQHSHSLNQFDIKPAHAMGGRECCD